MSPAWIEQMGVHHLPLGPDQPFYNVLVEDGTNRYAAQGMTYSMTILLLTFLSFLYRKSFSLPTTRNESYQTLGGWEILSSFHWQQVYSK